MCPDISSGQTLPSAKADEREKNLPLIYHYGLPNGLKTANGAAHMVGICLNDGLYKQRRGYTTALYRIA